MNGLALDPPDFWDVHRKDCPLHESKPWDRSAKCLCPELANQEAESVAIGKSE